MKKSYKIELLFGVLIIIIIGILSFTDALAYINIDNSSSASLSTGGLSKGLVFHYPLKKSSGTGSSEIKNRVFNKYNAEFEYGGSPEIPTYTTDNHGKQDHAIVFDNKTDGLEVDYSSEINYQPSDTFSLGGWVKITNVYPRWHDGLASWLNTTGTFFGKGSTGGSVGIGVQSGWADTGDPDIEPSREYTRFLIGSRGVS